MKTAFLILAHHQPAHLADLVEYLSAEWTSIFIHIDNKVNISEFEKQVRKQKDINFLQGEDRVKVHWGGFSQVRATLKLIEAAQNSGEKFNRYCLLSGSDFPIKNLHISETPLSLAGNIFVLTDFWSNLDIIFIQDL